jgi:hypothetical protein
VGGRHGGEEEERSALSNSRALGFEREGARLVRARGAGPSARERRAMRVRIRCPAAAWEACGRGEGKKRGHAKRRRMPRPFSRARERTLSSFSHNLGPSKTSRTMLAPSPPRRRARRTLGPANGVPQHLASPSQLVKPVAKAPAEGTDEEGQHQGSALLAHAAEVAALRAAVRGGALGVAVHTLTLSGAGDARKLGADAGRRALGQGERKERQVEREKADSVPRRERASDRRGCRAPRVRLFCLVPCL